MPTPRVNFADLRADNGSALNSSLLHSHHYKQSGHLPNAFYVTLCTIFQVETNPADRAVIGRAVFILTVLTSLGYLIADITFTIWDIKSGLTKQTVTTGLFSIFISLIWVTLGMYANRLGRRLLKSSSVVNDLRLHSKTVFKVPAAVLVTLLALVVVTISNYSAFKFYWDSKACVEVSLDGSLCKVIFILRICQTFFLLLFNCCVATAVLSICRTHTIGVRRFLRALENDGQTCELKHRKRFMKAQFSASHNLSELYLPERCYREDSDSDTGNEEGDNTPLLSYVTPTPDGLILSKDDILFSYWKLASRMRMTSRVLQRWMASWIAFTILWLVKWIITWLHHPSSYLEIAQFVLPLLMTLILCTAYGEANGEAAKIISSITPLQDRLDVIRALPNINIGMTLYSKPIEYSGILAVVAAMA
ncbi:hypothetical protein EB796_008058 [Bugula neritina]|uniref:Uncharacterized protein n=1 Tax=Bugula neritina TaxID=10212 RepID=A0A7J7K6S4_BUGNE|nr:hypothetical protein EB796_008058 [Bugula neritina]